MLDEKQTDIAGSDEPPFPGTVTTGYRRDLEIARQRIRARRGGDTRSTHEQPLVGSDRRDGIRPRLYLAIALVPLGAVLFADHIEPNAIDASQTGHEIAQASTDQVAASFVRDLEREPVPTRPVTRESIDDDVLYKTINPASWTDDEPTKQVVEDRVR